MPTLTETEKKRAALYSPPESYQTAEVWAKVKGQAVYGADLIFPGMLHGKILRSPHPHARIKKIDLSAARALSGVRAVICGADLDCQPYGIVIDDELPLAVDRVRYSGDEVAVVAAVNVETAIEALKLIKVDYDILPAVFNPREALQTDAPRLHDHFPGNIAWQRKIERGDFDRACREADLVVESSFSLPSIHPAYLEPTNCVAMRDQKDGLTLHTAVQSPDMVRQILARVLGLSLSQTRIIGPTMGGGFGGKVYGNLKLYLLASILAEKCNLPVKMILTREEEFCAGRPLIAAEIKMRLALRRDGTFLGREAEIITDNGAYSAQAPWVSNTLAERNDSVYQIPAIRTDVRLVYTNKVPTGQYRAYGNQLANFASESLIDMAAQQLDLDPLAIRLKNCVKAGDLTVHGLKIKSCALAECLQRAAAEIGWQKKKPGRGYGLSAAIHANGRLIFDLSLRGASALARLELDGRISLFCGEQDYGQGADATFSLIVARVLGLAPEEVTVFSKDTLNAPFSIGALAMRQTTIGGKAIMLAAEDLRRKMIALAADYSGEPVILEQGSLRTAAGRWISRSELAVRYQALTSGLTLTGEGCFVPPQSAYDQSKYGDISVTYSFAAHAAEVEIDQKTGALTVHRIVAVHDSGKILNRIAARGQVYGGVAQGLGLSCYEGYLFDQGQVANPSFADYKIPTALDLPVIEAVFVESPDQDGPFGAKGLGEIVQVPVPGAVANAVGDALGAWVTDLPITAEKIYQILARWEEC